MPLIITTFTHTCLCDGKVVWLYYGYCVTYFQQMANTPLKFAIICVFASKADADELVNDIQKEQCETVTISSIPSLLDHIVNEDRTDLIIIESSLLTTAKIREKRILSERINARKTPVLIVAENHEDITPLLNELNFEIVDLLFRPLLPVIIHSKINLFKKMLSYKKLLIGTIEEKKYVNAQFQHFIHVIAHDLKSPLSSAVFLLSILKDDERLKKIDDLGEYVQNIYQSNIHISDMITLIADYIRSSLEEQQVEMVDTKDMISQLLNEDEYKTAIKCRFDGVFPIMRTKKFKLQHVFKALIEQFKENEGDSIVFGVNEKNNHYEFSARYNVHNINDYKKTFILTDKPYRMDNHETNINLNTLKLLVEEQWGKIWIVLNENEECTTYFEWRK